LGTKAHAPAPNIGLVGVSVAIAVVTIAAIWKMAGLKADLNHRWQPARDIIRAGLDEQATQHLLQLYSLLSAALPIELTAEGLAVPFDPTKVLLDPTTLQGHVKRYLGMLTARRRFDHHYKMILYTGPVLFVTLIVFLLSLAAYTSYFASLDRLRLVGYLGLWFGLAAVVVSSGGVLHYFFRQQRLTNAELLSTGTDN